jgi:hypothetical protein
VDASGVHPASVKPATSTPVKAAAAASTVAATSATTAGIGVIGDQADGEQNHCCKSSENIAKHDITSLLTLEVQEAAAHSEG